MKVKGIYMKIWVKERNGTHPSLEIIGEDKRIFV